MARRTEKQDTELIAEILVAGRKQDVNDAYTTLLERYWKVVVALVRSRVSSPRDAEDLAQEAFVRAFRSLPNLKKPKLFLGWLLRIAQNLATDHLRRRRPPASLDRLEEEAVEGGAAWCSGRGVQERLEQQEEMEMVLNALGELPERYRAIVTLRYLKGLSNREVAGLLGEPEGTIRNRLFRALAKLRNIFENQRPSRT